MKQGIVYFVGYIEDRGNDILNWHEFYNPGEPGKIIPKRTRWQEIKLVERMDIPIFYFGMEQKVEIMDQSKAAMEFFTLIPGKPGISITYRIEDSEWKKVDSLNEYQLFVRSDATTYNLCIDKIVELGGRPLITKDEEKKSTEWFNYVDERFLKRKITEISLGELCGDDSANLTNSDLFSEYGKDGKLFIKTKDKKASGIVDISNRTVGDSLNVIQTHYRKSARIIISEPLNLRKDNYGIHPMIEYRAWVGNDQLLNISRYSNYENLSIDPTVREMAKDFAACQDIAKILVADFAIDTEKGPVLIECNGPTGSGRFAQNYFSDILHAAVPGLDLQKLKATEKEIMVEDAKRLKYIGYE